jgi:hypothetical protein
MTTSIGSGPPSCLSRFGTGYESRRHCTRCLVRILRCLEHWCTATLTSAIRIRKVKGRLGFYDFQAMGLGPYVWDVTYFITGALHPDDRSGNERDLLQTYLDGLRQAGVADVPTLDDVFLAHRRHMMHGYLNILTPVEMQPDRFAVHMGARFVAAMADLDTLGSLSSRSS